MHCITYYIFRVRAQFGSCVCVCVDDAHSSQGHPTHTQTHTTKRTTNALRPMRRCLFELANFARVRAPQMPCARRKPRQLACVRVRVREHKTIKLPIDSRCTRVRASLRAMFYTHRLHTSSALAERQTGQRRQSERWVVFTLQPCTHVFCMACARIFTHLPAITHTYGHTDTHARTAETALSAHVVNAARCAT